MNVPGVIVSRLAIPRVDRIFRFTNAMSVAKSGVTRMVRRAPNAGSQTITIAMMCLRNQRIRSQ